MNIQIKRKTNKENDDILEIMHIYYDVVIANIMTINYTKSDKT
jgi:hypothetical protein